MASFIFDCLNYAKSFLYTETTTPIIEKTSASPLKREWTVALGDKAFQAKYDQLLGYLKPSHGFRFDSTYILPNTTSHAYIEVGLNQGIVVEANECKPFTTQLGGYMAVQMRAFAKDGSVSHLSLVRVQTQRGVQVFKDRLEEILNLSEGKIEIFIGGGRASSQKCYDVVHRHIQSVQAVHNKRISLEDDCFTVIDLSNLFFNKEEMRYQGSAGIETVGFDQNNNPFLIPNVTFTGYEGEISGGEIGSVLDSDYRIKV